MRIFVTYKSQDIKKVEEIIDKFREISPEIQVSIIRQSKHWRKIARNYIKKSDFVIYLAGHVFTENINWEINCALKKGQKVYCVKLYDDVVLDRMLYIESTFDSTRKNLKIENPVSLEKMCDIIKGDRSYLHNKLFCNNVSDNVSLMEQYKMMLSTSESLIERRQKLTTTYLSIFSALLPVITLMLSIHMYFLYVGTIIISVICIILCFSWRNSIISYGKSNSAKFAILEEIEKKLPASIFSSEWVALKRITLHYKSFSDRETMIPFLFVLVYTVFAIIAVVLCFSI